MNPKSLVGIALMLPGAVIMCFGIVTIAVEFVKECPLVGADYLALGIIVAFFAGLIVWVDGQ